MVDAIAAVLLSMTMSDEGQPRILHTLFGVLMLGILGKGLALTNVDSYAREIITGLIIIIAVAASSFGRVHEGQQSAGEGVAQFGKSGPRADPDPCLGEVRGRQHLFPPNALLACGPLDPMRNSMRRSAGTPALCSTMPPTTGETAITSTCFRIRSSWALSCCAISGPCPVAVTMDTLKCEH